jgi:hypothetical protein
MIDGLARGLVQVGHLPAALAAAKVLAEQNCGTVRAEALDVVRGIENALMFAAPAYGDERHLGVDELSERAAEVSIVAAWRSHVSGANPATSADFPDR